MFTDVVVKSEVENDAIPPGVLAVIDSPFVLIEFAFVGFVVPDTFQTFTVADPLSIWIVPPWMVQALAADP